jgi:uncharacterized membrane protein YedE/YeeE
MIDCGRRLLFGGRGGFVGFVAAGCIKGCIKDTTFGHLSPQVPASLSTVNFLGSRLKILDT